MALWQLEEFSAPQFLGFIRSVPVPEEFSGVNVLPSRTISTLEYEYILGAGGRRATVMANVMAWDSEAPIAGKSASATEASVRGELPPIKRKARITEKELIKFNQPRAGTTDREDVIDQVYNLATDLVDAVQARVEWLRMQALSEDIVTFDSEGIKVATDFGIPVTQQWNVGTDTALSTWWTDTALSNPILDLVTICDQFETAHGIRPARVIADPTTQAFIYQNANVRDLIRGVGASTLPLTLEEVNILMSMYRLPTEWIPYNVQFWEENHNGTLTVVRPFNANKIVLLPPAGVTIGEVLWGPTAEANQIQGIAYTAYAPGIAGRVYGKDEPPGEWVKVAGTAFPTMPGAQYVIQVRVRDDL